MGWRNCFGSLGAAVIACAAASSFAQGTGSASSGGDVVSRLHECERQADPAARAKCIDEVVPGARPDDVSHAGGDESVRTPVADDALRPRRRGEGEQDREAESNDEWPQMNPLRDRS